MQLKVCCFLLAFLSNRGIFNSVSNCGLNSPLSRGICWFYDGLCNDYGFLNDFLYRNLTRLQRLLLLQRPDFLATTIFICSNHVSRKLCGIYSDHVFYRKPYSLATTIFIYKNNVAFATIATIATVLPCPFQPILPFATLLVDHRRIRYRQFILQFGCLRTTKCVEL